MLGLESCLVIKDFPLGRRNVNRIPRHHVDDLDRGLVRLLIARPIFGMALLPFAINAGDARVQSGTKSTLGTSFPSNDGMNSQCQPSMPLRATATMKSKMSSSGETAPSTNRGKPINCTASAMMASTKAARNRERGESSDKSGAIEVTATEVRRTSA